MYKIAIDAHNITVGGGLTHLLNILEHLYSLDDQYEIHLFASEQTLSSIPDQNIIKKFRLKIPNTYINRIIWQVFELPKFHRLHSYHLLFVPGSLYFGFGIPYAVLIQNLLPFSLRHILQYGISFVSLRLAALFFLQYITILRSSGVIYLSHHSRSIISKLPFLAFKKSVIIYHGSSDSFVFSERPLFRSIHDFSIFPARIVYVSSVEYYKNHDLIIRSLVHLKQSSIPFHIYFVGSYHTRCYLKLKNLIARSGLTEFVTFVPPISHSELPAYLRQFDLALWTSSCETFGISLLEYMSLGLPLVALDYPTTREIAGSSICAYHNHSPSHLCSAITDSLQSTSSRISSSRLQHLRSKLFSWRVSSHQTFNFFKSLIQSF